MGSDDSVTRKGRFASWRCGFCLSLNLAESPELYSLIVLSAQLSYGGDRACQSNTAPIGDDSCIGLAADGRSLGYPEYVIQKIEQALKGAYEALSIARQVGVKIGSGSDVLGAQQRKKAFELGYKGRVMPAMEVLIATTKTNAEIIGMQNELGTVETGKLADLLLVDGNPLDDLSILADRGRIHMVIQGGTIVADRRP